MAVACAVICTALMGAVLSNSAAAGAVIPLPAEMTPAEGAFRMAPGTALRVKAGDRDAARAAQYFAGLVSLTRGFAPGVNRSAPAAGAISFQRRAGMAPEGYELKITPRQITLSATTAAGLFYGAITLWELLPMGQGAGEVPAQLIRDAPQFSWRGLMLDSARHLQSPAYIRSMIDWMAWHKLNVLQWHLTDDQGWRVEIRRYPRLTSVGAWRNPPSLGPASSGAPGEGPYGGYYTQREIRELVAYAASRHVTIVPEIDMPGHAQAAIAAYPVLGSMEGPAPPVSARWGIHTYLYNLEPGTFTFIENVLREVIELFPSRYIHVGGDEAVKDQWRASALVQARAQRLGITDPEALQGYFTERIGRFLAAHGRRLVGWDEILRPGLASDAIVMSWHGTSGAHAAAIAGNDTILAPWPTLYFDNRQSTLSSEPPGRTRVLSLEDVYRFDPHDATLSEAQGRHVLGLQANIWTEHISTEARVDWMALPRAAAVAELGWSPAVRRQWPDFLQRLAAFMPRYRALGPNSADSAFAIDARISASADHVAVTLANQTGFGEIRYTLDGQDPAPDSPRYAVPLEVTPGTELHAATFAGQERLSQVWSRRTDLPSIAHRSSRELELCSDGIGLLLEPPPGAAPPGTIVALDLMNPCWMYREVDLTHGAHVTAAVVPLPFNFEIGADAQKIPVGDARSAVGELEIRVDSCSAPPLATLTLTSGTTLTALPAVQLTPLTGRHDLCLRFARPALNPMWALDWVEITE
ncbi:MAG TPA: family 20 glycosylhydrolase [Steroidobacteraceae bacterium]|nr:family 20 glycosylhydrolase [Steroidobacteraceae bacterium]